MHESKLVGTPLDPHTKFSITHALSFEEGRMEMKTIPYTNRVESMNLAHVV